MTNRDENNTKETGMRKGYFHRVQEESPAIFWIDNPTPEEVDRAIAAGARDCTYNPSFCQKMIDNPNDGLA